MFIATLVKQFIKTTDHARAGVTTVNLQSAWEAEKSEQQISFQK